MTIINRKTRTPILRRDDGVSMVLVAIVMVVLIAMVGFALDVGAIYSERAQLSRGADAAVLAIAEECINDPSSCDEETMLELAQWYASLNVNDGAASIFGFDLDLDQRRVEVITQSLDPEDGSTELKMSFLRVLGFTGTTVHARAVAIWGYLRGAMVAPFTFPDCVYWDGREDDNEGEDFIYPFRNVQQMIEDACEPGLSPPGGFGYLDVDDSCATWAEIELPEDDEEFEPVDGVEGDPGNNWVCSNEQRAELLQGPNGEGAIIIVPLHDPELTILQGNNALYTIVGIVGLRITGYRLPGSGGGNPSWIAPGSPNLNCPPPGNTCIRGRFVDYQAIEGELGGSFGVTVVRLVE